MRQKNWLIAIIAIRMQIFGREDINKKGINLIYHVISTPAPGIFKK